jgi:hypothetical protein
MAATVGQGAACLFKGMDSRVAGAGSLARISKINLQIQIDRHGSPGRPGNACRDCQGFAGAPDQFAWRRKNAGMSS